MDGERHGKVAGLDVRWHEISAPHGGDPILYVHGVPDSAELWEPFLARTGGIAPDLPGFGASDKPNDFDYSIAGYAAWLRAFVDDRGLDRFALVAHDWGALALALAQQQPDRVSRLVLIDAVPLLEGYRWHQVARQWRRPVIGELAMGFAIRPVIRRALDRTNPKPFPPAALDAIWSHFDQGTQRAILKLYRSAPETTLAREGERLGSLAAPSLVCWGARDPFIDVSFAERYAAALGGESTVHVEADAGHWPWLEAPALVDVVAGFVSPSDR